MRTALLAAVLTIVVATGIASARTIVLPFEPVVIDVNGDEVVELYPVVQPGMGDFLIWQDSGVFWKIVGSTGDLDYVNCAGSGGKAVASAFINSAYGCIMPTNVSPFTGRAPLHVELR
jgi:hypothetical protein